YFLELAERVDRDGPDRAAKWRPLADEYANVRAAADWGVDREQETVAARFAHALWWFCRTHDRVGEGRAWIERVLDRAGGLRPHDRIVLLSGSGDLAMLQGDEAAAVARCEEALVLARGLGDPEVLVEAAFRRGWAALYVGDDARAEALLAEVLVLS